MKLTTTRMVMVTVLVVLPILAKPAWAKPCMVSQPFNTFAPNFWTSENNPAPYAQVWASFEFPSACHIIEADWVGGYNPAATPITGWTVGFYNDNSGVPGSPLFLLSVAGSGGEIPYGTGSYCDVNGCFPTYSYSAPVPSILVSGLATYWFSVVPDLTTSPPDWGWGAGPSGSPSIYQCVQGNCGVFVGFGPVGASVAFDLIGEQATPEPSSLLLLATGILGLAGSIYRRS
jgi:PEP-CTERM motif